MIEFIYYRGNINPKYCYQYRFLPLALRHALCFNAESLIQGFNTIEKILSIT